MPDYNPALVKLMADPSGTAVLQQIPIVTTEGQPVSGLPNEGDTPPVGPEGTPLPYNPNGLDPEGIVRVADGTFWLAEEYGPSLVHLSRDGRVLERWMPRGRRLRGAAYPVAEVLPAALAGRRADQGLESLAVTGEGRFLYTMMEAPLSPARPARASAPCGSCVDTLLARTVSQWVYLPDAPPDGASDLRGKVSALSFVNGGTLLAVEETGAGPRLYSLDLGGATSVLGGAYDSPAGSALDDMDAGGLSRAGSARLKDASLRPRTRGGSGEPHRGARDRGRGHRLDQHRRRARSREPEDAPGVRGSRRAAGRPTAGVAPRHDPAGRAPPPRAVRGDEARSGRGEPERGSRGPCRALPRPGGDDRRPGVRRAPGREGANQAYAAGRLGARVRMVGRVGADDRGRLLVSSLEGSGVGTTAVRKDPGEPTGVALITIDATGQNQIVIVPGANGLLSPEDVERERDLIASAGILLLQLEVPLATVEAAARIGRAGGALVVLDPAPARVECLKLLPLVDYVTPNETELASLVGEPGRRLGSDEARALARALLGWGPRRVVAKLGAEGAFRVSAEGDRAWPGLTVAAVDTTAAGDVWNGAFATALAEGASEDEAGGFANVAAAISVTRAGAQPSMPTRAEVDERRSGGSSS